jgi:thioredoxin 1
MVTTVSSANFKQTVLESKQPVLVDFWAPWCGPCLAMGPIIDDVAKELEGKVTVAKLNVDDNPDVAQSYGVMSIPTMFVFKDGQPVERLVGVTAKDKLKSVLDHAVS